MAPRSTPPKRPANSLDPKGEFPLAPTEYFFHLMFHISRRHDARFEVELSASDLTAPRWRILAVIRRMENCTMNELALFTGVDRTTLTRAVDQLVSRGLVERSSPSRDRRKVHLALSVSGEELYMRTVKVMLQQNQTLAAALDDEALRAATRLLQQTLRALVDDGRETRALLAVDRPQVRA